ncbi:MAG: sensor domain-containing protein [Steroidobacteraceae bacterium]
MSAHAPRSIDEYLKQLRSALDGADPALIQDALYDSEEYLRAELAAHPGKSEADVLELIASTYGAPEEVAAAYRATDAQVSKALKTPQRPSVRSGAAARFFGVFLDPRAYLSLFFMLLAPTTGVLYFTFAVTGLSLSLGLAILIIGVPFFLAFIGIARVISLGEGRLLEAITGERMPRRPVHPGPPAAWWTRILDMLRESRTWTTILYLLLMLPLGVIYCTVAVTGLGMGAAFVLAPFTFLGERLGWFGSGWGVHFGSGYFLDDHQVATSLVLFVVGIIVLTLLMHLARAVARVHTRLAKVLLVEPAA